MPNRILNAKETADFLKISVVSLYRLVSLGQIQCFRVGRIYRFSEEQIADFIVHGGITITNENKKAKEAD